MVGPLDYQATFLQNRFRNPIAIPCGGMVCPVVTDSQGGRHSLQPLACSLQTNPRAHTNQRMGRLQRSGDDPGKRVKAFRVKPRGRAVRIQIAIECIADFAETRDPLILQASGRASG